MAGIRNQLGPDEDISPNLEFPSNEFINPGLLYCFETAALECRWEALYPLDCHSWWCWTISHFESLLSRQIPRLFLHSDARVSGERLREVDPKDKESLQRAFCSYHPSGGNVDRPLAGQGNNWQACRQGPGPHQFWGSVKSCRTIECCKVSWVLCNDHGGSENCSWSGNSWKDETGRRRSQKEEKVRTKFNFIQLIIIAFMLILYFFKFVNICLICIFAC